MWIEKTKNGKVKYCERVKDITGKIKKITHTMEKHSPKNEKIAREVLRLKEKEIKKVIDNNITFFEALDIFEKEQVSTLKEQTRKIRKYSIKKLKNLGYNTELKNINARFIEEVCNLTSTTPLSYNVQLWLVKNMIRFMFRKDYINDISFLMKLRDKKHIPTEKIKYLEQEEIDEIIKAVEDKIFYKNLIEFLLNTGLRGGECLALTFDDIDGDTLTVNKTLIGNSQRIGTPKNSTSFRKISLNKKCLDIIESQRIINKNLSKINKNYRDNNIIFSTKKGTYTCLTNVNHWFKKNIKSIYLHAHMLRHTHASLCIDKGIPLELISSRLGHKDIRITREIYIHKTKKQKKEEMDAFKRIVF